MAARLSCHRSRALAYSTANARLRSSASIRAHLLRVASLGRRFRRGSLLAGVSRHDCARTARRPRTRRPVRARSAARSSSPAGEIRTSLVLLCCPTHGRPVQTEHVHTPDKPGLPTDPKLTWVGIPGWGFLERHIGREIIADRDVADASGPATRGSTSGGRALIRCDPANDLDVSICGECNIVTQVVRQLGARGVQRRRVRTCRGQLRLVEIALRARLVDQELVAAPAVAIEVELRRLRSRSTTARRPCRR
jgi:hypothetical protein